MTSPNQQKLDEHYMAHALEYANSASDSNEVPVGALIVQNEKVIGAAGNRCVTDCDPSAHAEINAMREAGAATKSFRLDGATLYVTLEPCLMCCGALLQARVSRLVYGAREPRTGGVVSIHDSLRLPGVLHHVNITEGVLAERSSALLHEFFLRCRAES